MLRFYPGVEQSREWVIQSCNSFMDMTQNWKARPAQKISLFQEEMEAPRVDSNPQDWATEQLLEISDEAYYDYQPQSERTQSSKSKKPLSLTERNSKPYASTRLNDIRPVMLNRTSASWKMPPVQCITGEEVCVMKKDQVISLSQLLMNGNGMGLKSTGKEEEKQEDLRSPYRRRATKQMLSFMRKRNLNYGTEPLSPQLEPRKDPTHRISLKKFNNTPVSRINMSCQLRREAEQSPVKSEVIKGENRQWSPPFRNKRVTQYTRFRMTNRSP